MRRFSMAIKAFLRVLKGEPIAADRGKTQPPPAKPAPTRSDAIALLAALQQEARLVDFIMESLSGYSDAQIGAAARDVHDRCRETVVALFGVEPLSPEKEGATVTVPASYDPVRYKLIGEVGAKGPFAGTVQHPGWIARKCDIPVWTGRPECANIIGPIEVELAGGLPARSERP